MAKYRVAIGDMLQVPVKGEINDADKVVKFDFTLTVRRLDTTDQSSKLSGADYLRAHTSAWKGQRLVIDEETGHPAEFSAEALEVMFSIVGMESVCWSAYLQAMRISETPAGRRGNS